MNALMETLQCHTILKQAYGKKIAIACSGGKDSMALAYGCYLLGLWDIEIFTVDHGIHSRSQQYAQEIKHFWDQLKRPAFILKADSLLIAQGQGIEDGARKARYRALSEAAVQRNCCLVLLGHHALDQVETMLMRLDQASGLHGLKGIPEQRDIFIRPLLSCSTQSIEQMLEEYQIPYWEDPTNQDQRYLRNQIRLQIIPVLQSVFGEGFEQRFALSASFLNQSLLTLNASLEKQSHDHLKCFTGLVCFDMTLLDQPDFIQAHWLHQLILKSYEHFRSTLIDLNLRRVKDHIYRLQALWQKEGSKQFKMELPYELMLVSQKQRLLIYDLKAFHPLPKTSSIELTPLLQLSRELEEGSHPSTLSYTQQSVNFGIWRFELELIIDQSLIHPLDAIVPLSELLQRESLVLELALPPQGLLFKREGGHKKLRHLWGDLKVSIVEREFLPVIFQGKELLYAPYLGIDQSYLDQSKNQELIPNHQLKKPYYCRIAFSYL